MARAPFFAGFTIYGCLGASVTRLQQNHGASDNTQELDMRTTRLRWKQSRDSTRTTRLRASVPLRLISGTNKAPNLLTVSEVLTGATGVRTRDIATGVSRVRTSDLSGGLRGSNPGPLGHYPPGLEPGSERRLESYRWPRGHIRQGLRIRRPEIFVSFGGTSLDLSPEDLKRDRRPEILCLPGGVRANSNKGSIRTATPLR